MAHYRRWKAENQNPSASPPIATKDGPRSPPLRSSDKPTQIYGEPLNFRGLRHAPTNDQGVVYLFGMLSRELGFVIESLQSGFPDCEAKYLYDLKKRHWAIARIEFEFRASNFKEHGHDPSGCDFIVCWENDWPDSPIPIIALKTEILKLPN